MASSQPGPGPSAGFFTDGIEVADPEVHRALLAENLGKASLWVIISDPWYYPQLAP
tara:strand:- start:72 stop:239 length:168 start_codon:yes stop_codon:yes gene_type:complete